MTQTKATRLEELSQVVPVPKFFRVKKGVSNDLDLDTTERYMVRSSAQGEDGERSSHAGQYLTFGPLEADEVWRRVEEVLELEDVQEVIVQKYVSGDAYGVAFCFSSENYIVEYSSVFEGVTAGSVDPFVAQLPCEQGRYRALQEYLKKIYEHFGPSDVEFIGLSEPRFVQVRPITRMFDIDTKEIELKMQLQEMEPCTWIENDVCRVIAERQKKSAELIAIYTKALPMVYGDVFGKKLVVPRRLFLGISGQFFMDTGFHRQLRVGLWMMMKLGFKMPFYLKGLHEDLRSPMEPVALMRYSIIMSMAYDLFKKQEYFDIREKLRLQLDEVLQDGVYLDEFQSNRVLSERLSWDRGEKIWKQFGYRDGGGVVVVEGDVSAGPFFRMDDASVEIPSGVVVLTEQLYASIGAHMGSIKGVVCKHGALTSHVAILAREHKVPLIIQADIDQYV